MKNSTDTPLISICIPTYNRGEFLARCLTSIIKQKKYLSSVEIIVSDNNSTDNTRKIVESYKKKYSRIFYYKNKTNIGLSKNIIKCTSYAKGEYIWFLGDDDKLASNSLSNIIRELQKFKPDVAFTNLDFINSNDEIVQKNILKINKNYFFQSKRNFFNFLLSKFDHTIDWYTTFLSNYIVKRSLIQNTKEISKYHSQLDIHPHTALFYYVPTNYSTYISSQTSVFYHVENKKSFGPKKYKDFVIYMDKVWKRHYDLLVTINKEHMPYFFLIRVYLKNLRRSFYVLRIKMLYFFKDILLMFK